MWMFDTEEFQTWLAERDAGVGSREIPPGLQERCLSCGTKLELVPYADQLTCGFCLAYEFGSDNQHNRFLGAISGLARVAGSGDPDVLRYVGKQLVEDVHSTLSVVEPLLTKSQQSNN
jgi:hypothetical protein